VTCSHCPKKALEEHWKSPENSLEDSRKTPVKAMENPHRSHGKTLEPPPKKKPLRNAIENPRKTHRIPQKKNK
jgi:hypothetical protein